MGRGVNLGSFGCLHLFSLTLPLSINSSINYYFLKTGEY
jgi:hypothetical protein